MKRSSPKDVRLDEEQQDRLKRCLRRAVADVSDIKLKALETAVACAMVIFLTDKSEYAMTYREVHDAIRKLWQLASKLDPPMGQIRARIKAIPEQVIRQFDYLAPQQIPKRYSMGKFGRAAARDHTGIPIAEREALRNGGFRAWAAMAADQVLILAIQTLLPASGVVEVQGRSRGTGKRSRPRIEPYIMGTARGSGLQMPTSSQMHSGGRRPNLDFEFLLIGRLANAWEGATGIFPSACRSDETGFGELVYSVSSGLRWMDKQNTRFGSTGRNSLEADVGERAHEGWVALGRPLHGLGFPIKAKVASGFRQHRMARFDSVGRHLTTHGSAQCPLIAMKTA